MTTGRRPYFKFYFEDFLNGVRKAGLTPEEVGMYVMLLGFIWEDEGATSRDPAMIGVRTGWGKRLSTRLVKQLVDKEKVVETDDGRLTNARMEREIVAFVNVKKAAQAREEAKRKSVSSPTIEPLESDYRETNTDLFSEKRNEINEWPSTAGPYTRIQNPESRLVCVGERAGARAGEEDFGFGVYVNCRTVRHHDFQISLEAIDLQLMGKVPMAEVKSAAIGHALQWAAEIENGRPPHEVVPVNIANFISKSIGGRGRSRRPAKAPKAPVGSKNYWQELAELAGEGDV